MFYGLNRSFQCPFFNDRFCRLVNPGGWLRKRTIGLCSLNGTAPGPFDHPDVIVFHLLIVRTRSGQEPTQTNAGSYPGQPPPQESPTPPFAQFRFHTRPDLGGGSHPVSVHPVVDLLFEGV